MENNPILVLISIAGIFWFAFSLCFIITQLADIKAYKECSNNWRNRYEDLNDTIMQVAHKIALGQLPIENKEASIAYLKLFKDFSNLQLILCHILRINVENEQLKTHIKLLLEGRE